MDIDGFFGADQQKQFPHLQQWLGAQRASPAAMELDLTPKLPKQVYGGDGGSYFAWCPEELPMLKEGNIGAAKLALKQYGFAVPRYSDSPRLSMFFKFCIICLIDFILKKFYKLLFTFVIHVSGSGTAGIVLPEKEEKVIAIKKGDSIALPFGVVTWWFNSEEADLEILFLELGIWTRPQ
ncbi:BnaC05g44570D [Brassica napus]|uniref:BnaC05g44570D protein n=1 Tax=Brassica napus TaxID=3708 RepID=A0A078GNF4_BRANA|nr:BnaC05g44570D [Brassica napus]